MAIDQETRAAAELIHDALEATEDGIGYHDRGTGIVDMTSDELAAALLRAGWVSPAVKQQVVQLHRETTVWVDSELPNGERCREPDYVCAECEDEWPCKTLRLLSAVE